MINNINDLGLHTLLDTVFGYGVLYAVLAQLVNKVGIYTLLDAVLIYGVLYAVFTATS